MANARGDAAVGSPAKSIDFVYSKKDTLFSSEDELSSDGTPLGEDRKKNHEQIADFQHLLQLKEAQYQEAMELDASPDL